MIRLISVFIIVLVSGCGKCTQILIESTYSNNLPKTVLVENIWLNFTEDGELDVIFVFEYDNNSAKGTGYYPFSNHNKCDITFYDCYEKWRKKCLKNQKLREGYLLNAKKEGEWIEWHPNGKIREITNNIGGDLNGLFKHYSEDGILLIEGHYLADQSNGEFKYYYDNGKLLSKGNFINDKKDGLWIFYSRNGSITSQEVYELGELVSGKEFNNK